MAAVLYCCLDVKKSIRNNSVSELEKEQLESVGFTGKQLEFKINGFNEICQKFIENSNSSSWGWGDVKKRAIPILKLIDIILGSLTSLPCGLEPFKEFKESVELRLEIEDCYKNVPELKPLFEPPSSPRKDFK